MDIREVTPENTPNEGRLIWNANDRELANRLNMIGLNVRNAPYAAAGDGLQDDSAAIQRAIDDTYQAGGGNIYLPAGTYQLQQSLVIRENVNLIGAGMYITTLLLGSNVNRPVLIDEAFEKAQPSAFGKVYMAHFGIDGNRSNNPGGQEGIFTTAYFSTFENLYIRSCQTHGIRMGFSDMSNASSQNRVAGCRIADCGGVGIYLDINGIDHTITQNYIYDCEYGVLIRNGGIRVVNNAIYSNRRSGVRVEQTSFGLVIAANDFNGNRQHGIEITRTRVDSGRGWSQFLISSNTILGDKLEADNLYDGIHVTSPVVDGISKLTLIGNKIFTLGDPNRYRNGIHLEEHVVQTKCAANHIDDTASSAYFVGSTCADIEIDSMQGGYAGSPVIPASGQLFYNPYHVPVTIYVKGGDVLEIAISGQATGLTGGMFRLPAAQTITLTYNSAPEWQWFRD